MNTNLVEFLEKLGKLTEEYNIEIYGCGCCGSPLLMQAVSEDQYLQHEKLECDEKSGKYRVEEDKSLYYAQRKEIEK